MADPFLILTEEDLLARCIYGEARGEPIEAQVGVASVVMSRYRRPKWGWGTTVRDIILQPKQFSAFNEDDPNRKAMLEVWNFRSRTTDAAAWRQCQCVANGVLSDHIKDNTFQANHYHSIDISPPSWADQDKMTARLAHLVFYRL